MPSKDPKLSLGCSCLLLILLPIGAMLVGFSIHQILAYFGNEIHWGWGFLFGFCTFVLLVPILLMFNLLALGLGDRDTAKEMYKNLRCFECSQVDWDEMEMQGIDGRYYRVCSCGARYESKKGDITLVGDKGVQKRWTWQGDRWKQV